MFDPARATSFRREFIDVAKRLEPIDARVLPLLNEHGGMSPSRQQYISSRLGVSTDHVELAFRNLKNLELTWEMSNGNKELYPVVTALGRQFLACVQN